MRLLLDTHVAIWAITGDPSLPPATASMIADPANDVAVSMATLWEIAIKNSLRRSAATSIGLSTQEAAREFAAASFEFIDIALRHVSAVEHLPRIHGDPFDRLLVATALADTFRLMTHDRALAAYGDHIMLV